MTKIKLLDKTFYETNPLFTSANSVIEITKPLKSISLNYFTFDRHYVDNSRVSLTSSADWVRHYWEHKLYENSIFERDHLQFSGGHVLWSWLNREPVYSAASLYGIDHGITITEKHEGYCDFFNFGSVNNNSITSEYLIKNLPFLHQFAAFFKFKMKDLIFNAEKHKFRAPTFQGNNPSQTKPCTEISEELLLQSMGQKDISRVYLGDDFENSYLTRKEL